MTMKPPLANARGGFLRLECWEGAPRLVGCRVVCAIPTPSRVMAFRPVLLDRFGRQSGPGGRRIGGLTENHDDRIPVWIRLLLCTCRAG